MLTIFDVDGIKEVTPDSDVHNDTTEDVDGPNSDKDKVVVVETTCFLCCTALRMLSLLVTEF